ncbi:hypothetical protein PT974_03823 [Cladobotryum mycophilum]|uniref:Fucose-specific lectin n=1 Tax=Cladobotryum mycophilum TaxID=491253 RepID=A0ABR0STG7_9HYPO
MSHTFRIVPRDGTVRPPEPIPNDAPDKQPRSYWIHEDSAISVSEEECCSKRHWLWGCGVAVFFVILIATLVGVLGSRAAHYTENHANVTLPTQTHIPDTQGNSKDGNIATQILVHPKSPLAATSISNAIIDFKALVFHDADFDLIVIEWHGNDADVYKLKSRMRDDEPPRPLEGTSIRLVTYGPSDDLHLFYIDEDHRIVHLVQAFKMQDKQKENPWRRQKFVTKGNQDGQVVSGLRLTTVSFPRLDYKSFPPELAVLYQVAGDNSSLTLATSSDPVGIDRWTTSSFKLKAIGSTANLTTDSRQLVVMPLNGTISGGPARALRVLWDEPTNRDQDPFGMMECFIGQSEKIMKDCFPMTEWKDASARKQLAAANPIQLIEPPVHSYEPMNVDKFVLPVLDTKGKLSELYWDGAAWSDQKAFSVEGSAPAIVKSPFTSVSITENSTLFAVADGRLLEFMRLGKRWEGSHGIKPDWLFLGILNMTYHEHKGRMTFYRG